MEPEICTKILGNLSEKLGAKVPVTTLGYSLVKIACLDVPFSVKLEASPVEGQSLQQIDKERRKRKKNVKKRKA